MKVRTAQLADAESIANVHIRSWQEAYKNLLPQKYLDQLPKELPGRIENWKRSLTSPNRWTLVAEDNGQIVGFVLFGPPRDPNREGFVELGAIYLLASHKGKGIGFALLSAGFNQMKDRNYHRAYCWVLENNPTINFYEKTGASFNGQTKEDEIGGKSFNELAYEWKTLDIGDYDWKPLSVAEVQTAFSKFKAQWWIAGGWAIDLFLETVTREHEDIDILILRDDQLKIQSTLSGWNLWVADPPGTLRPWKKDEFLKKDIQDIWARKTAKDPWQIQIMLFDSENEEWIFKRDESIRKSLKSITLTSNEGVRFLSPEIQLLYKSKSLRKKDQLDFENVRNKLSHEQKRWLKQNLIKLYGDKHFWVDKL